VHDDVLALRELTGMQYAADSGAADPAAALRVIVDGLRDEGASVGMVVEELPPLPAAHRAALIRVGREALRNAGQARPRRERHADPRRRGRDGLRHGRRRRPRLRPGLTAATAGAWRRGHRADRVTAPATSSTPSRTTAGANETAGTG
jgi:hypothetical protein